MTSEQLVRPSSTILARKWMGLAAAMWVEASAGNAYTFAFYSPTLKHVLHYHQFQLNNLGVAKDIGENVGLIAGILCNALPPWALLSIGAICGFLGYGVLWLVVGQQIGPLPYWQMCIVLCVGANSTTWLNTAALVTCMRNFPHSRGTVAGILKGFVGLSAAIFTQVFTALLASDAISLLKFLALGPPTVCLAAMLFIRPVPTAGLGKDRTERRKFTFFHVVCVVLALFLLAVTLTQNLFELDARIGKVCTAVMVAFLVAPIGIPIKTLLNNFFGWSRANYETEFSFKVGDIVEPLLRSKEVILVSDCSVKPEELREALEAVADGAVARKREEGNDIETQMNKTPEQSGISTPLQDDYALWVVGEGAVRRRKGPRRGEDFTLQQALVKADFWLLFFTFFCGVGTGVTAINNLGQIGEAQGYSNVTIFVSLISIWNFLGRLGGGALSEHYVRSDAIPRTVWMATAQVFMVFAHLLFASAVPGSLYIGSIVLGLSYGVHFSIMVPTASELFGLAHFGVIYNFLTMANPLGSFLFSGVIAGWLYDQEAKKYGGSDSQIIDLQRTSGSVSFGIPTPECIGPHCFRLTFIIMACICGLGISLSVLLTYRIRRVYLALYGPGSPSQSAQNLKNAH